MRNSSTPSYHQYVGIDYSGAKTPAASLKGLRVFMADRMTTPVEVQPPPSSRKYWTRRGIAEWLLERLSEEGPTLLGIDHGFSFPLPYFEKYNLPHDWPTFLDDFQCHWPTDGDHTYVDFVRDGTVGNGGARTGDPKWKRLTEVRAKTAKSVFHFDVQGSVAKSTHAGLPWLRVLRHSLQDRVHFWPFDGWALPAGKSAIIEVYPRLFNRNYDREGRTDDQHDAWSVATWLRDMDMKGTLLEYLEPTLTPAERTVAEIEGWILGIK